MGRTNKRSRYNIKETYRHKPSKNLVLCLYGKLRPIHRVVAYCDLHKCYLEPIDICEKKCNKKHCVHKYELDKYKGIIGKEVLEMARAKKAEVKTITISTDTTPFIEHIFYSKEESDERLNKLNKDLTTKINKDIKDTKDYSKKAVKALDDEFTKTITEVVENYTKKINALDKRLTFIEDWTYKFAKRSVIVMILMAICIILSFIF